METIEDFLDLADNFMNLIDDYNETTDFSTLKSEFHSFVKKFRLKQFQFSFSKQNCEFKIRLIENQISSIEANMKRESIENDRFKAMNLKIVKFIKKSNFKNL